MLRFPPTDVMAGVHRPRIWGTLGEGVAFLPHLVRNPGSAASSYLSVDGGPSSTTRPRATDRFLAADGPGGGETSIHLVFRIFDRVGFVTRSPRMIPILEMAVRWAETPTLNILLQGETGTGKEVMAHAIRALSNRAHGPFIAINCGAIPENLLESELFGHKRGAFTDAIADKPGLIEQAGGGTLFLDEIGDLPLHLQAKFLRAMDEKKVTRVGDSQPRPVDFRLIAATNKGLLTLTETGTFRPDLYYRIAGGEIDLPPLRKRPEDIPLLADLFVRRILTREGKTDPVFLAPEFLRALLAHDWPGNVRELQNVIERAMALRRGTRLTAADIPPGIPRSRSPGTEGEMPIETLRAALEQILTHSDGFDHLRREAIWVALRMSRGNLITAARILRTTPTSLRNEIARLEEAGWKPPPL